MLRYQSSYPHLYCPSNTPASKINPTPAYSDNTFKNTKGTLLRRSYRTLDNQIMPSGNITSEGKASMRLPTIDYSFFQARGSFLKHRHPNLCIRNHANDSSLALHSLAYKLVYRTRPGHEIFFSQHQ